MERPHIIPLPAFYKKTNRQFSTTLFPHIIGENKFDPEINLFTSQLHTLPFLNKTATASQSIYCIYEPSLQEKEAYELEITPVKITIKACKNQGMFHGLQTLWQLVLNNYKKEKIIIDCAIIKDKPRFSWRGFMLDSSRHFYSVSFIKKLIDLAAMHHLNIFHWHLTDDQGWRFPVDSYPLLTKIGAYRIDSKTSWEEKKIGGFYTKEEIRDIVSYAQKRHIEIVPEVDFPGHASAILASYPKLGCTGGPYKVEDRYGIFKDVLCVGNELSFALAEAVFDSLAELFPSNYVHIGGDEVPLDRWKNCPKCQDQVKKQGLDSEAQLQSWVTARLVSMLQKRGKTAIGWDEVLEGSEKLGLPKDLIIMSWRGQEGGIQASSKGHRVIMTPLTNGCYLNFKHLDSPEEPGHLEHASVKKSYTMDPITPEMTDSQKEFILGGQGNLWSEVIYASKIAEYMLFPRLSALSESFWTDKQNRNLDSFEKRLSSLYTRLNFLDTWYYRGPIEDI